MKRHLGVIGIAIALSAIVFATWALTGRHVYTKFEVVERVPVVLEPDDPLAGTGFYDDEAATTVTRRPGFHLGLLPVPQGVFDKHVLSVATLLALTWIPSIGVLWWWRRRQHRPG